MVSVNKVKEMLKSYITDKTSKEELDRIASIDKALDDVSTEAEKLNNDYNQLKGDYINLVKNTGFKAVDKQEDTSEVLSFEEFARKQIEKGKDK